MSPQGNSDTQKLQLSASIHSPTHDSSTARQDFFQAECYPFLRNHTNSFTPACYTTPVCSALRDRITVAHFTQSQKYPRPKAVHALLLTALLALPFAGCSKSSSSPPNGSTPDQSPVSTATPSPETAASISSTTLPPNDSPSFVGTNACRECHTTIADTWQQHPMANSMAPATTLPASSNSITPVVHGITRSYDVRFENGRLLHRDIMLAADGQPVYSQEFAMDYVVGSGQRSMRGFAGKENCCFNPR
ncbi:MAG UNVERIFIED_CONTAM: hypothetical protein LVR18_05695 [Planctomycetaceae bacterium]